MNAGTSASGGPNQLVMAPIIAVGTATGQVYLVSISSGQVSSFQIIECCVRCIALWSARLAQQ